MEHESEAEFVYLSEPSYKRRTSTLPSCWIDRAVVSLMTLIFSLTGPSSEDFFVLLLEKKRNLTEKATLLRFALQQQH